MEVFLTIFKIFNGARRMKQRGNHYIVHSTSTRSRNYDRRSFGSTDIIICEQFAQLGDDNGIRLLLSYLPTNIKSPGAATTTVCLITRAELPGAPQVGTIVARFELTVSVCGKSVHI